MLRELERQLEPEPSAQIRALRSRAEARILDPISTEGLTKKDAGELTERLRTLIGDALDEMRAERSSV